MVKLIASRKYGKLLAIVNPDKECLCKVQKNLGALKEGTTSRHYNPRQQLQPETQ